MTNLEYTEKICGGCHNCPAKGVACALEDIRSSTTLKGRCTTYKCVNAKKA